MFGKIHDNIYDGTLHENWKALVTFQQMIVLCNKDGVIDMTPKSLSARTGIPLTIIQEGIKVLEAPDPGSRTKNGDGARIARLDEHRSWGWMIVNHQKYRDLTGAEAVRERGRERQRRWRNAQDDLLKQELGDGVTGRNAGSRMSRHTDTDTDTDTEEDHGRAGSASFAQFWTEYPRKVKRKAALAVWLRKGYDCAHATRLVEDVKKRLAGDRQWRQGFIPDPTTYLNGERWEDEIVAERPMDKTNKAAAVPHVTNEKALLAFAKERGIEPGKAESWQAFRARVVREVGGE